MINKILLFFRRLWGRITGHFYKDMLRHADQMLEARDAQIDDLRRQLNEAKKDDRRANFELKATLTTKLRVWYRENKGQLSYYTMREKLDEIKAEINDIEADLLTRKPAEKVITPDFVDYTRPNNHQGLSKTAR